VTRDVRRVLTCSLNMGLSLLINLFLNLSLDALEDIARQVLQERLPIDHISTLEDPDKIDALRACLIVYALTSTKIVPRTFQLQASIATLNGRDTIITAGTGCGKTLCLLIPMLLRPNTISLTISPLKRLQTTQANNPVRYSHASAA
jgi:superfamily II DNA or RNA helicase